MTIYAPPGAVIPKSGLKLVVAKIRGVTSYGMLCSESELKLSDESEGITELPSSKYSKKIEKIILKNQAKFNDLSITPNRPDCLGVRGIARDLAASGFEKLKEIKLKKLKSASKRKIKITLKKEKIKFAQFLEALITNVKNTESPEWLKQKLISIDKSQFQQLWILQII